MMLYPKEFLLFRYGHIYALVIKDASAVSDPSRHTSNNERSASRKNPNMNTKKSHLVSSSLVASIMTAAGTELAQHLAPPRR